MHMCTHLNMHKQVPICICITYMHSFAYADTQTFAGYTHLHTYILTGYNEIRDQNDLFCRRVVTKFDPTRLSRDSF